MRPYAGAGDVTECNTRIASNREVHHGNRHRSPENPRGPLEQVRSPGEVDGHTKTFYMTEALAAEIDRLEYEYGLMNYPGGVWLRGMPV